jgi:hypothetical protein
MSFFLAFPPISYMHSSSSHSCYVLCPSHSPWLDHSNYVWRGVQVMKLLIMQFSPISRRFMSHVSTCAYESVLWSFGLFNTGKDCITEDACLWNLCRCYTNIRFVTVLVMTSYELNLSRNCSKLTEDVRLFLIHMHTFVNIILRMHERNMSHWHAEDIWTRSL